MDEQLKPREEVLRAFKEVAAKKVELSGTWAHRVSTDPDHAWRMHGEFGVIAEMAFERRLKFIHETNKRQCYSS